MIVRRLEDVVGSEREVRTANWTSRRLLLAGDGMGFSMHDTLIEPGTSTKMCYRNHLEAVYCVAGRGMVEDLDSGEAYAIEPGVLYGLDGHEEHVLTAETELRLVCVFSPPVVGDEVHDETGAYPANESTTPSAEERRPR